MDPFLLSGVVQADLGKLSTRAVLVNLRTLLRFFLLRCGAVACYVSLAGQDQLEMGGFNIRSLADVASTAMELINEVKPSWHAAPILGQGEDRFLLRRRRPCA